MNEDMNEQAAPANEASSEDLAPVRLGDIVEFCIPKDHNPKVAAIVTCVHSQTVVNLRPFEDMGLGGLPHYTSCERSDSLQPPGTWRPRQ